MSTDSQPEALPLAQALMAWSDPALLSAIRDAEAAFAPGELERLDRDPLDSITDRRMQPRRGRIIHLNDDGRRLANLERAWSALLNAFQVMVEREAVMLEGRMTKPELRSKPEALPCAWATELTFDVRGAAVFMGEHRYVGVVATRPQFPVTAALVTATSDASAGEPGDGPIDLLEALTRWTNPKLVEEVRVEERGHTRHQMTQVAWPLLSAAEELAQPHQYGFMAGHPSFRLLDTAWTLLIADFRNRLVRGEFHLIGVMAAPERATRPVPLPGVWAADMRFEFLAGAIAIDEMRYVAVAAMRGPSPDLPKDKPAVVPKLRELAPITPDSVGALSDDEVLLLLEEHARRVVEVDEFKALDPGISKPSFMPILARKLRARAEAGEMLDTVAAEARVLEKWIQAKAPSHQTPKAGPIRNALRELYRSLGARSKSMIA